MSWKRGAAAAVVLVSQGYPDAYPKGIHECRVSERARAVRKLQLLRSQDMQLLIVIAFHPRITSIMFFSPLLTAPSGVSQTPTEDHSGEELRRVTSENVASDPKAAPSSPSTSTLPSNQQNPHSRPPKGVNDQVRKGEASVYD